MTNLAPTLFVRALASLVAFIAFVPVGPPAVAHAPCPEWTPGLFGAAGPMGTVRAFGEFDDGTGPALFVAGSFREAGPHWASGIAKWSRGRWTPAGFGLEHDSGGTPVGRALVAHSVGARRVLFVGGRFSHASGVAVGNVVRFEDGVVSPLGGGVEGEVNALALFDDGTGPALYAGGSFRRAGGVPASRIARWDGVSWSPLGDGLDEEVHALAVFDDGTGPALYAAGEFQLAGGLRADRCARWDGAAWSAVAVDPLVGWVSALAVHDDGNGPALYAAGKFRRSGADGVSSVARLDRVAGWMPLARGVTGTVYALGTALAGSRRVLVAGGLFDFASGVAASGVATWDGVAWSPVGDGLESSVWTGGSSEVLAVVEHDDGDGPRLWAGGTFEADGAGRGTGRCARFVDPGVWRPPATGIQSEVLAVGTVPAAFGRAGREELALSGRFTSLGSADARFVARYADGEFAPLGSAIDGDVLDFAIFDDGAGPTLFACGLFYSPARGIARWDGSEWRSAGADLDSAAFAMTVHDDGTGPALYVGGAFSRPGRKLVRYDGTSWTEVAGGTAERIVALESHDGGEGPDLWVGTDPSFGAEGLYRYDGTRLAPQGLGTRVYLRALASFDDGSGPALFLAGSRLGSAGFRTCYAGKWDATGLREEMLGFPRSECGSVNALAVHDDGTGMALYAGGSFGSFYEPGGDTNMNRVARWDGASWNAVAGGLDFDPGTEVNDFAVVREAGGSALYAGGQFKRANGAVSRGLARYFDPCAACGAGNVNLGLGQAAPVLYLNDSTGGVERRVEMARHEPVVLFMDSPPAALGGAPFALFAWNRAPERGSSTRLGNFGSTCLPTPLSGGSPQPVFVWNGTSSSRLGAPDRVPPPAPTVVFRRARASPRPVTVHFQGLIRDPGAAGPRPASVTNGVTLVVR